MKKMQKRAGNTCALIFILILLQIRMPPYPGLESRYGI